MLESTRQRFFFTDNPENILELIENFASNNNGQPEETDSLGMFKFADPAGGRRFLSVSIRENTDQSDVEGKITLRWRDEPDGTFSSLAGELIERLKESYELLSLAEARKLKTQ